MPTVTLGLSDRNTLTVTLEPFAYEFLTTSEALQRPRWVEGTLPRGQKVLINPTQITTLEINDVPESPSV